MAKSKSKKKWVVLSIIGVLLIAGIVAAKMRKKDPPIAISEEKVTRRNITEVVPGNGKVEPVIQVKISPEVSGEITLMAIKEGEHVKKGDLLFKIKPDNYVAARNQAQASYNSSIANRETSAAQLEKADLEYKRNDALYKTNLISESDFLTAKTAYDVAKSTLDASVEQVSIAKAQLENAEADLSKTTVYSPLTGTVSQLNTEQGERVVGTAQMAGTEVMTVADLNTMEARVDIGEIDVPLIKIGQKVTMDVDSFKDQKFDGIVTEVANSANNNDTSTTAAASSSSTTDATKFQVRIRISQKDAFLPGMSVTADVQTRYRTNVLSVPIQSVTTRLPSTNGPATNSPALTMETNARGTLDTNDSGAKLTAKTATFAATKKPDEPPKPIEVAFVVEGDHVKMVPVKRGISDDNYVEILEGLHEGEEVVSGGYKAINRDLEDGKKVTVNTVLSGQDKQVKPY